MRQLLLVALCVLLIVPECLPKRPRHPSPARSGPDQRGDPAAGSRDEYRSRNEV